MRWIIGDIHGMLRPLEALLRAIEQHDPQRTLIFVGDYVNRGPDSRGVIDLMLSLNDVHCLRGNHDDVFDQVLCGLSFAGKPGAPPRVQAFTWFMQHGLDKTFISYGVDRRLLTSAFKSPTPQALDELAASVPPAHKSFIRNLAPAYEAGDLFVAHAKWEINTPTLKPSLSERLSSEIVRYSLLWGRYREDELFAEKAWERTGYFGHTPVDTYLDGPDLLPIVASRIVLLDTAVALVPHGRLTAVCHESGSFFQTDVQGKLVTP